MVGVTLSWANPQDDHVDGRVSSNRSKRGLIKGTLKAMMKVHSTNALRVRQAKKILLAGATFERKDLKYGRTRYRYTKPGGFEQAQKDYRAMDVKHVREIDNTLTGHRWKQGVVGNDIAIRRVSVYYHHDR